MTKKSPIGRDAFPRFEAIARTVQPERLIAKGWRTSGPKIIDNAIVAYVAAEGISLS